MCATSCLCRPWCTCTAGALRPTPTDTRPTCILPAGEAETWRAARAVRREAVGERTYRYPLEQRAATLWYHDHTMDFTGPNVYRGLAGFLLVDDDRGGRAAVCPAGIATCR